MNSSQINKIIKLNNEFYQKTAIQFSNSRKYPWKGWFSLLPYLKSITYNPLSIVDLGCGNGRFLEFLCQNIQNHTFDYTGIDSSDFLLKIAKSKFQIPNSKFEKADIFNLQLLPKDTLDVVVAFGITHHIPDSNFRKKWFSAVSKLVNINGFLVLSFWYPNKNKLLDEKLEGFEEGDYLMGWGMDEAKRYMHIYSTPELDSIGEILAKNGLVKVLDYKDATKGASSNLYIVYKKAS